MRCRLVVVIAVAVAVLLMSGAPATALSLKPCARQPGFVCGVVTVPLDRTGAVPGTIGLRVAATRRRPTDRGVLLALAGGPGQGGVSFVESFRASLAPALSNRRLIVLDQRGTGRSGALRCPALQASGALEPILPEEVGACATALGPRRTAYGTADTVLDLEAVRAAFRAERMGIMGISYGTFVATQYARRFPARVESLVLDSVVGADGIDPYLLDTFAAARRILAEQCAGRRCRLATADPVADVAALAARLRTQPVRGTRYDARGSAVAGAMRTEEELLLLLIAGDLNPYIKAQLPGAIKATLEGDPAALMRMRRLAQGPPTSVLDLSAALNVTTACADAALPYALSTPIDQRPPLLEAGLASVGDEIFAPFSRQTVLGVAIAHDCLHWPEGDVLHGPAQEPLPDVPALLLAGRQDLRTPMENAEALAARMPRATLVALAGTGHDVLDSDLTGCAAAAVRRFAAGAAVGSPCRGRTNAVAPLARPARSLDEYRRAPGVAGVRGRELFAVLDTIVDARVAALQTLYGGFERIEGGGLRGGSFRVHVTTDRYVLRRYSAIPGVHLTGTLRGRADGSGMRGAVRVDGPGALDGRLVFGRAGRVSGVLGGRRVDYRPRRGAASARRVADRRLTAGRTRLPSLSQAARRLGRADQARSA